MTSAAITAIVYAVLIVILLFLIYQTIQVFKHYEFSDTVFEIILIIQLGLLFANVRALIRMIGML